MVTSLGVNKKTLSQALAPLVKQHVFIVESYAENDIEQLLSRSLLPKSAYEYTYSADTYEELYSQILLRKEDFERYDHLEQSFCVKVPPSGRKKGINCLKSAEVLPSFFEFYDATS
ncbi:unnamed protein product [Cylicocyclus nassatus]|uniref:Uncharacterized protein n=1 Tax=Cylicocyclus nassatus TaxID=53992 RepID=A0AA36GEB0_CYLNA|nr:unnamed protein product [Cylicocyclus nassatus]